MMRAAGLKRALDYLVESEREHGLLPAPDYDLMADLAEAWSCLWPLLLELGSRYQVVCSLIAGVREPGATAALTGLAWRPDHDTALRSAALIALARGGAEGAETLLLELLNADPALRLTAAQELARLSTPGAMVSLSIRLGDPDPRVRRDIATALALAGDRDAIAELRRLLAGQADAAAGRVLGDLAVPEALPDLLTLLYHPEPNVRSTAIEALTRIGDPRALPCMIGALGDESHEVRSAALRGVEGVTGGAPSELARMPQNLEFQRAARRWWASARMTLHAGRSYLRGQPLSLLHWIRELDDVWRLSLQPAVADRLDARLRAATGVGFGFGFDAWSLDRRTNAAALREWHGWWREYEHRFPAGGWYWLGETVLEPA